jgi:hypothetical protein
LRRGSRKRKKDRTKNGGGKSQKRFFHNSVKLIIAPIETRAQPVYL